MRRVASVEAGQNFGRKMLNHANANGRIRLSTSHSNSSGLRKPNFAWTRSRSPSFLHIPHQRFSIVKFSVLLFNKVIHAHDLDISKNSENIQFSYLKGMVVYSPHGGRMKERLLQIRKTKSKSKSGNFSNSSQYAENEKQKKQNVQWPAG